MPSRDHAAGLLAVVVDDEPAALGYLARQLRNVHGFRVLAIGDPVLARDRIRDLLPDVVFLDLQMPDLTGFELLDGMPEVDLPAVVIVTAYGEHAVRSYDYGAVDYLLKPFDDTRLSIAVNRVKARVPGVRTPTSTQALAADVLALRQRGSLHIRFLPVWSSAGQRATILPVDRIFLLEADHKSLIIRSADGVFELRGALQDYEARLDSEQFIRVSRSAIVNATAVREVHRWFRGQYVLLMADGKKVKTTSGYRDRVQTLFGLRPFGKQGDAGSGSTAGSESD